MNEDRTGKCLRQVEHIRGNLWHRYSIAVNQVMVAKWWLPQIWSDTNQHQCKHGDKRTERLIKINNKMNPLQKNRESIRIKRRFYAEIVADITTSQLKTWKHIIWQHEHHEPNNIIQKYIRIILLIYLNTVNIIFQLLYESKHQLHANIIWNAYLYFCECWWIQT